MNTVFVVQNPLQKSLLPAEKFGKLHVVLNGHETLHEAVDKLVKAFKSMSPSDYLIQVGSPMNIGIATHLALEACDGSVQLLIWDRVTLSYNIQRMEITCKK